MIFVAGRTCNLVPEGSLACISLVHVVCRPHDIRIPGLLQDEC